MHGKDFNNMRQVLISGIPLPLSLGYYRMKLNIYNCVVLIAQYTIRDTHKGVKKPGYGSSS